MAPAQSFSNPECLFNFVVRDGNGVKGLADSGLREVPPQYVQPHHERIDKSNATLNRTPPIDMSKLDGLDHDKVAEEIAQAAMDLGFFQVVNHGVPLELLEKLKDLAHKFFAQPPEKKNIYLKDAPLVKYGTSFAPEKEKTLEWKDYLNLVYTNDVEALHFWPDECKEAVLEYRKTGTELVRKIIRVLMEKLGVSADDSKIDALIGEQFVNMNFYPVCPNPELTVGVGRHSDLGTLTVLLQDGIGGLYVKLEENKDNHVKGEWMEIPPIPGALVINIGDTLQIVSNGKYKSAEHRVRTTNSQSRVSVPVFTMPKGTEKIGPFAEVIEGNGVALYKEVVFGEFKTNFFENPHDGKKSLDFARIY